MPGGRDGDSQAAQFVRGRCTTPGARWLGRRGTQAPARTSPRSQLSSAEDTHAPSRRRAPPSPAGRPPRSTSDVAPLFRLAAMIRDKPGRPCPPASRGERQSLTDARAEIDRTLENVETACGMPVMAAGRQADRRGPRHRRRGDPPADGRLRHDRAVQLPRQLPFCSPLFAGHRNTYVVKHVQAGPLHDAAAHVLHRGCGFPKGVFNLINADRAVPRRSWSTPTCRALRRRLDTHGRVNRRDLRQARQALAGDGRAPRIILW